MPPLIKQLQSKPELKTPCSPPKNVVTPLRAELWLEIYIVTVQTQIYLSCPTLHYTAIRSCCFIILGQKTIYPGQQLSTLQQIPSTGSLIFSIYH